MAMPPRPKVAIYHGFNETYEALHGKLSELKRAGYDAVQTSPPHRFRSDLPTHVDPRTPPDVWWLAYQPISYEISNKYGDAIGLKALCDEAHTLGMLVIVDICVNFMSALRGIEAPEWDEAEKPGNEALLEQYWDTLNEAYPPFKRQDYHPRFPKAWATSTTSHQQRRWKSFWFNTEMPGLRLDSPTVRSVHFEFLNRLASPEIGVDGFRVDAALYQTPEVWRSYFERYHPAKWVYLEIFERFRQERVEPYRTLPFGIEDFIPTARLVEAVNEALSNNTTTRNKNNQQKLKKTYSSKVEEKKEEEVEEGELGFAKLSNMETTLVRLHDVTFSLNHDTYSNMLDSKHGISGLNFFSLRPSDPRHRRLERTWDVGHAILLAMRNGIPLILNSLAQSPIVQAGLQFRSRTIETDAPNATFPIVVTRQSTSSRYNPKRSVLWMERGEQGWLVCNCEQDTVVINQLQDSALLTKPHQSIIFKAIDNPLVVRLTSSSDSKLVAIQSCIEGDTTWTVGLTLLPGSLLYFLRSTEDEKIKLPDSTSVATAETSKPKPEKPKAPRSRVQGASWAAPSKTKSTWGKK